MAVSADFEYFNFIHSSCSVTGPVLEIGGRSWQGEAGNLEAVCRKLGLGWEATDLSDGPGVSFQLDILDTQAVSAVTRQWPTIAVFNLLEHVYDPICALRNAIHLLAPGGVCIVVGPAVWQLHQFPADYWRPLPDFFIEFGRREGVEVPTELFRWLVYGSLYPLDQFTKQGEQFFSSTAVSVELWGVQKSLRSRIVHRIMRTYGRETAFPFVGLGLVLMKPAHRDASVIIGRTQ